MIADKLPSVGSHVGENKASMSDFIADLNKFNRPADVPIPGIKTDSKMDRAEMERVRDAVKERVEKQGKKGYDKVRDEVN